MIHSLRNSFNRIFGNVDGSVAVLSAVIIPLSALLLFVTVDTGRTYVVKSKVQEAVDSALLAAVATKDSNGQKGLEGEFEQVFTANVAANFAGSEITQVTITETLPGEVFDASAHIKVPLSYRWGARQDAEFNVTSQVTIDVTSSNHSVEIAMALDNTASMTGDKITALKTASNQLVDIIFGANAMLENVNVSIIPYDVVVRFDDSDADSRLDWIQASSQAQYSAQRPKGFAANRRTDVLCATLITQPDYTYCPGSTCQPEQCYPAQDAYDYTYQVCNGETGCQTYTGHVSARLAYCQPASCCVETVYKGYSYWYGNDRACIQNSLIDADDTPPTAGDNWKFRVPAAEAGSKYLSGYSNFYGYAYPFYLAPMLFASNNKREIQAAINNMAISGSTRIHVGLMWGWFTLSEKWKGLWDASRADLPKSPAAEHEKVLILMTDGKNYFPEDDAVTKEVCNAVKISGITVYTIGFGAKDDINEALLQGCASELSKYFYAPTNEALENSFKQIAGSILYPTLRISK